MNKIQAVLFDLDGTLLDTAPDLAKALNKLCQKYDLPEKPLASIRSLATYGSKVMLKQVFGLDEQDINFNQLREEFFTFYQDNIAENTTFFPQMENVLIYLAEKKIPWGIVTNKLTRHTEALLKELVLPSTPSCIICGDSVAKAKPDPAPILQACRLLNQEPEQCLYIGDAFTDVSACKAAGTPMLVALYGYINPEEDPHSWLANGYINEPMEIITWLERHWIQSI